MSDRYINFKSMAVTGLYDAAATDITVDDASGIVYPVNMVWYNKTSYPGIHDDQNVEIVRATSAIGNVITVIRNQEGTGASTKNNTGCEYVMIITPTAKTISDLVSEIAGKGDMDKAVYDTDGNGIVDNAEALDNGEGVKTYADISTEIDDDIITHNNLTAAHGVTTIAGLDEVQTLSNKSISDTLKVDTINEHGSAGVTVEGVKLEDSILKTNHLTLRGDALERYTDAVDDAGVSINYFGYNAASDYCRDLNIYDGKQGNIIFVDGSSKETDFSGDIKVDVINEHTTDAGVNINRLVIPAGTEPSNPVEGMLYMNSTTHNLMLYNGSTWETITSV